MKQSEYLRELRENLEVRVSQEELSDILADYESFFAAGKEEGKTEDDISAELGSPAFLAKSLLEDHGDSGSRQTDNRITTPNRRMMAFIIDAVVASLPVFIVTFIIGIIIIPVMMLFMYPSPVYGALSSLGFATFTSSAEIGMKVENLDNTEIDETDKTIFTEEDNQESNQISSVISISAGISLVFYLFYSLSCTLFFKGQTIGKKIMHIKVRRSSSHPAKSGTIIYREFIGKLLLNSIPLVPVISFFTILFTKEHKALHDMLADTIVSDE
ncbi:RDD family protein [Bacillaceae bacterium Marseille-Q3522]|nr:RDD family protein [Bacillaceae bacterium Marseille-Q3522]